MTLETLREAFVDKIAEALKADNLEKVERLGNVYGQLTAMSHCGKDLDAHIYGKEFVGKEIE